MASDSLRAAERRQNAWSLYCWLNRTLILFAQGRAGQLWVFNWLTSKIECGTRPFYGGESCTDRNLCMARPKNEWSCQHSLIGVPQALSHELSPEKQVLPGGWSSETKWVRRHAQYHPLRYTREDCIWRPSESGSLQRKSARLKLCVSVIFLVGIYSETELQQLRVFLC